MKAETKAAKEKRLRNAAAHVRRHQKLAATVKAIKCPRCLYLYCHPCRRSHCAQHCMACERERR